MRENPGPNYGPWLPSGSNLHSHQKSALGLTGSMHGQAFSEIAPLEKTLAPIMNPGCQVAAIFTAIKNQHWETMAQGMARNFL